MENSEQRGFAEQAGQAGQATEETRPGQAGEWAESSAVDEGSVADRTTASVQAATGPEASAAQTRPAPRQSLSVSARLGRLQFHRSGKFRVLQVTDIQDGPRVSRDTLRLLEAACDAARPDLVIFTGDQIAGYDPAFLATYRKRRWATAWDGVYATSRAVSKGVSSVVSTFGNGSGTKGGSGRAQPSRPAGSVSGSTSLRAKLAGDTTTRSAALAGHQPEDDLYASTRELVRRQAAQFLAPLLERGIPFALTYGNHDFQCGLDTADLDAIYQEFPGCLNPSVSATSTGVDGVARTVGSDARSSAGPITRRGAAQEPAGPAPTGQDPAGRFSTGQPAGEALTAEGPTEEPTSAPRASSVGAGPVGPSPVIPPSPSSTALSSSVPSLAATLPAESRPALQPAHLPARSGLPRQVAYACEPGTFALPVTALEGDATVMGLVLVDSGDYAPQGGYGTPSATAVEWLRRLPRRLGAKSIVFQHIPLPQFYRLLRPVPPTTAYAIQGYRTYDRQCYVIDEQVCQPGGYLGEGVSCPDSDVGEFDAMQESDGYFALFAGHDHRNAFVGQVDGITLGATPTSGFGSYGPPAPRRAIRLFEFDIRHPHNPRTQLLEFGQMVGKPSSRAVYTFAMSHLPKGPADATNLLRKTGVLAGLTAALAGLGWALLGRSRSKGKRR